MFKLKTFLTVLFAALSLALGCVVGISQSAAAVPQQASAQLDAGSSRP